MVFQRSPGLAKAIALTSMVLALALFASACSSDVVSTRSDMAGGVENPIMPPAPEMPTYTPSSEVQPLSLDNVFRKQAYPNYELDPAKLRTIVATGDIIPARMTNWQMVQKNDFKYPFEPTAPFLTKADVTIINLESPLVKGCQPAMQGMSFCGDQRFVDGLIYAGVDIVNLANNHSENYGSAGLSQTVDLLTGHGITVVGIGNEVVKDLNGIRFGYLAYNGVGPSFDREAIRKEVSELRRKVDVLVVAMHWGKEYVAIPSTTPGIAEDDPREMGRIVIDAGADFIIGNHPHWVQGVEMYKGKLITYAHGNFIFDQEWSRETKEGIVGKYTFYDTQLVNVELVPVLIENYAQPRFMPDAEAKAVLDRIENASRQMANSGQ